MRRISPSGVITTVAGNGTQGSSGDGPALAAQLNLPFGVSPIPGNSGGFLIADAGNSRIRRVAADGTITTVASQLASPHAVAALTDGGFLGRRHERKPRARLGDRHDDDRRGDRDGRLFRRRGPAAAAALNQPKALAVLPDLSGFLVGDSANNRVRLVRSTCGHLWRCALS